MCSVGIGFFFINVFVIWYWKMSFRGKRFDLFYLYIFIEVFEFFLGIIDFIVKFLGLLYLF